MELIRGNDSQNRDDIDPPNHIDQFQVLLLIELEKLDWGSILDNKSDGHAR